MDYQRMLESGQLDVIAVTDHDTIDGALRLRDELGDKIIVGEEITTSEGEIIGLYLSQLVPSGQTPEETVQLIRAQNGLVYIPHPFETVRKGLPRAALDRIATEVDIVEIHNGRAYFQDKSSNVRTWAVKHKVAMAASSDAHGPAGWGRTHSVVTEPPTRDSLARLLVRATYSERKVGLRGIFYPKLNRLRKRFRSHA
jgi:predicted metal-dependent phosphoesterase TrpH